VVNRVIRLIHDQFFFGSYSVKPLCVRETCTDGGFQGWPFGGFRIML
jgi:hypothetical protein